MTPTSWRMVALLIALVGLLGRAASAEIFVLPPAGDDVIGAVTTVEASAADTLVDIARRHGLGYNDMVRANPAVDPWLPGEGTEVLLPTQFVLPDAPRRGVVLNLPEYRLYYFIAATSSAPAKVMTYPISIGRMDWETPLGMTKVVAKNERPSWYPPTSIRKEHEEAGDPLPRVVPPGPDNPLGDYAVRLGLPGYLIHGTNRPAGVGMRVTHGCIRMFPEDIAVFFASLPVGTPVRIVNQPVKLGWLNGALLVEAHVPLATPAAPQEASDLTVDAAAGDAPVAVDIDELADGEVDLTLMMRAFVAATRDRNAQPDWQQMEQVVYDGLGVPVPVGKERVVVETAAQAGH
ncbi:MAG: L,D-transpeptidase family protein [Pseudomonadota bacterium]